MKRVVINVFIVLYVAITIVVTLCLIKYNQFNVTEFKDFVLIIPSKTELTGYSDSDLLVVDRTRVKDYKVDDEVIYYNVFENKVTIESAKISAIRDINENERTATVNNKSISSEYLIGNINGVKKYALVGSILSVLTSKYGYLITIIFPILLFFIYEVYSIIMEIKKK